MPLLKLIGIYLVSRIALKTKNRTLTKGKPACLTCLAIIPSDPGVLPIITPGFI